MSIFQKSVIKKYLEAQNSSQIDKKWLEFQKCFHNIEKQENIRNTNEDQYQEGFLRELFVNILGYTINPDVKWNLIPEKKNTTDAKSADGAIIIENKVKAVIELKSTKAKNLKEIETQAFGYKNSHAECDYIITSSFEKLRFYIDNKSEHEEFDLFTLTKEEFNLLYLCLSYENLKRNIPTQLKEDSVSKENIITKKLYKDYSEFKSAIFNNLVLLNPQYDKLLLYKKTQKLLDRFLFIFFAEDRLLVPTNLIRKINLEWQNFQKMRIPVKISLYDRYKTYFNDLNEGATVHLPAFGKFTSKNIEETHEIFAYNGGLFKPDDILDNVQIEDDILYKHSIILSDYDFDSDVDVNILGHIFENSLNEIDEIKSEIEGNTIDKKKSKRKKDGVFYTPKYITKYIVENTIGKLCEEKKTDFEIIDEEFAKGRKNRNKTTIQKLDKSLHDYRDWLLQITICDPACGSGAFLNQALEFLIREHKYIDELESQLIGTSLGFPGAELHILENNIYGVDLNDESVEIAKLSLWLRTAQKGRKLNSLNNNIKCGNSLIDDVSVAGDKAFSWEKEFPEVFERGGFDVIIGNPPYVDIKGLDALLVKELFKKYSTAENRINLYSIFIEKGYYITKNKGILSFINPNSILINSSYTKIRKMLVSAMTKIIKLPDDVFEDATVETIIFQFQKNSNINTLEAIVYNKNEKITFVDNSRIKIFEKSIWKKNEDCNFNIFISKSEQSLLSKIEKNNKTLDEYADFCLGITPYDKYRGHSSETIKNREFHSIDKLDASYKPLITGENITRYTVSNEIKEYIKYGEWLGAARNEKFFKEERILVRQIVSGNPPRIYAGYTNEELYFTQIGFGIISKTLQTKFLLCLINSSLLNFYHKFRFLDLEKELFQKILIANCKNLPIKYSKNVDQQSFVLKADLILSLSKKYSEISKKFSSYFSKQYKIEKLPSKLEKWYGLEFTDFIKELNKSIKTVGGTQLSKKDEFDWIDLFEENKKKAIALKSEIYKIDKEIDLMVYKLYELSYEEILIIDSEFSMSKINYDSYKI